MERQTWGDELDNLDTEPAPSIFTSPVRSRVLDGGPVAVQVERSGLARWMGEDLVPLERLTAPLSAAFRALDDRTVL